MATQSCVAVAGGSAKGSPYRTYTRSCLAIDGGSTAMVRPAWAGAPPKRKVTDWLPRFDEPAIDLKTGRLTQRWYAYFRELGNRIGGTDGASLLHMIDTLNQTQSALQDVMSYSIQLGQSVGSTQSQVNAVVSASGAAGVNVSSVPPPQPQATLKVSAYQQKYGNIP